MKGIGDLLKESRLIRRLTLKEAEESTKIKGFFLHAIEKEEWGKLPDFPVVTGFVKNYADLLGVDHNKAVALLRRDYPPERKKIVKTVKPRYSFRIGPRSTFAAGVTGVVALIAGYLLFQYIDFTRPPELNIRTPIDSAVVFEPSITVSGKTSADAVVKVNNQGALVDDDGNFEATIELKEGPQEVFFEAKSRSDKITKEIRRVIYDKDG